MHISVTDPTGNGRVQLNVLFGSTPWRVRSAGESEEALLDPAGPGFLAEGYPPWLSVLCAPIDADRVLAESIVREIRRRR